MDPAVDPDVASPFAGPWPDGRVLVRTELARYLDDVRDGSLDELPTRCEPWTVRDVTIHLTETFGRFRRMLAQGRGGDFTPPFTADQLDVENLRAVEAFLGDPVAALITEAEGFLDDVSGLDEPMPHQIGTLPAGLQVLFGLMDLALHHEDVLAAAGRRYQPEPETVTVIYAAAQRLFGLPPDLDDPWPLMVQGSGR